MTPNALVDDSANTHSEFDFLWVERFRPSTVAECVLPERIKSTFIDFISEKSFPNLLLAGPSGCGKTTVAKALCRELQLPNLFLNASVDNGIDVLRTKVSNFCRTATLSGAKMKVVILDEADRLNAQSTQPALRSFIEEHSSVARFILTCNHPSHILQAVQSRLCRIDFDTINQDEKITWCTQVFQRLVELVNGESLKIPQELLANLVQATFPDIRQALNRIQQAIQHGEVNLDVLKGIQSSDMDIASALQLMKAKEYTKLRAWVHQASSGNSTDIYQKLFIALPSVLTPQTVPQAVIILSEYSYRASRAIDLEIHTMACLTELMLKVTFA